jgi:hypothetical protein
MKANHGAQYEISIDGVPRTLSRPEGYGHAKRAAPEIQESPQRGQVKRFADRRGVVGSFDKAEHLLSFA